MARSKPSKIVLSHELRVRVQELLDERWSPEQISRRLKRDLPDRPELHACHETIYQALYVQGRGAQRRGAALGPHSAQTPPPGPAAPATLFRTDGDDQPTPARGRRSGGGRAAQRAPTQDARLGHPSRASG
ncbi:hypothetical protein GCM10023405_00630 [Streptomonospora salina]